MASQKIGVSLQRLASGKRINSVFDGTAADSAMIVKLDAQARGIRQSIMNVNEVQSITTTADSALNSMLNIAYNIRELAQKGTDSSLTSTERDLISSEVSGLLEDLTSLANNTTYTSSGGVNTTLLDNSFGTKTVQAGPNAGNTFSFSIGDARTSTLGQLAIYSGAQGTITNPISGNVTLNGTTIESSISDGLSTNGSTYSSIAIVNAINTNSSTTGVYAESVGTIRTLVTDFATATVYRGVMSSGDFKINSVSITGTITSATALASAINAASSQTGVIATVSSSVNVTLTATDGRNISITLLSGGATASFDNVYDVFNLSSNASNLSGYATLSGGATPTYVGAVRIWSSEAITIGGTNPSLALGIASGSQALVSGTDVASLDLSTATLSDQATKILDATIAQISTLRAEVGAVHDRIDYTASYLLDAENAAETAKSSIQDTDFVQETLNLVMAQLLQDSGLAAMAQANLSQEKVTQLLQNL